MPFNKTLEIVLKSTGVWADIADLPKPSIATTVDRLVFSTDDEWMVLTLRDVEPDFGRNIQPTLSMSENRPGGRLTLLSEGPIQYIDVITRLFVEQPSGGINDTFGGVIVAGSSAIVSALVDDDIVGAFALRVDLET